MISEGEIASVIQRQDELLGVSEFSVKEVFKQKFLSHMAENYTERIQP